MHEFQIRGKVLNYYLVHVIIVIPTVDHVELWDITVTSELNAGAMRRNFFDLSEREISSKSRLTYRSYLQQGLPAESLQQHCCLLAHLRAH